MFSGEKLNICFMGGKQAGITGALTMLAAGNNILSAVSYSDDLTNILSFLGISICKSIKDKEFIEKLKGSDLLVSVQGREIVSSDLLNLPLLGAINVHPYLYKYKGADPIKRALEDSEFRASVGVHYMSEQVDKGKVIVENFLDISRSSSVEEVYNKLYPYYSKGILEALGIIIRKKQKV